LSITAADASGGRLGRYKVVERRDDGSLLLAPEAVDEVIAETTERPSAAMSSWTPWSAWTQPHLSAPSIEPDVRAAAKLRS
jgi:hypothetical protein